MANMDPVCQKCGKYEHGSRACMRHDNGSAALIIPGAVVWAATLTSVSGPRTKKTHGRIVTAGAKPALLPSIYFERWEAGLRFSPDLPGRHLAFWASWRRQTKKQKAVTRKVTGAPVALLAPKAMNCRALFYVERDWNGDAVGYYQAVADALESWGVVPNDKWITSWDGSRIRIDAARPRVEVTLTLAEDAG